MKKLLNVCLLLVGITAATFAQKPAVVTDTDPGWHKIGDLTASFKKQDESLMVLGADEFKALKIKIKDAPIHILRMQVFYQAGEMEDIDVRQDMKPGESSGALQLKHAGRDIGKIAFTYHSVANDKAEKAVVEVYGLKTGSDSYDHAKNEMKNDAQKVEDKIDEGASKAAAAITDQKLDTKVGPNGQTIYVDENAKYYYIDEKGEKVFVTEVQLKDK